MSDEDGLLAIIYELAEATAFTPAERALLVEQGETLKLDIEGMMEAAKNGSSMDVLKRFASISLRIEWVDKIMQRKLTEAANNLISDKRHP